MRRAAQSTHSSDAIPTHWTLELLAFDEKYTFDYFLLYLGIVTRFIYIELEAKADSKTVISLRTVLHNRRL
jgi:hypothetical protein